ncbi:aminobenzoyl-glutamate utilization protein B [Pseudarcicella hirudinis]|uniref:Aminobenzoyl-glutamate utilization protein B n=1 Tax=Pseudarcicella hirudinis TaxID=1079859 RepID=A0A1I5XQJ1_9BACT|nr:amidohydrolase [Pseudarcicella hirudinis]SFQ34214.1 aminobenzoyl-glutamate utilization protein B [Pseudarcicella hirudinis]
MKKTLLFASLLISVSGFAQKKKNAAIPQDTDKQTVISNIDKRFDEYAGISKQIWNFAELGYLEEKSSALLQEQLKKEGFTVQAGVAGIPTAFVATYGEGKPVIGILGEYDALPGLAQEVAPEIKPIPNQKGGHGCGHNLFGTASVAAAVEVKNWLKSSGQKGTVKIYGCPAEEGGSGKVYMVREGLFNDVDVVLHWHPGSLNSADAGTSLANKNGKFRFKGIAAHASASPERGRSALDGVEAMDNMVNMMREHIPSDTRIHYVITKGGEAPNVVPAFAEVYYYARNKDRDILQSVWKRIENAAQGAALGTGTKVEWEVLGGVYNLLPNITLAEIMHNNLVKAGGVIYNDEEKAFAEKISQTLGEQKVPLENAAKVKDFRDASETATSGGSTDVGDVSWTVPTVGLSTATWVPGSAAHSWQSTAASGMTIGQKGMIVAAKTLACTAIDLYKNQSLIEKARAEWLEKRGANFKYEALLGDRKPALDYRK